MHRWCSFLTKPFQITNVQTYKCYILIVGLSLWLTFGYDVHISSIYLKVGVAKRNKAQMPPVSSVCGTMIRR